eukprot:GHVN01072971.1.p1 GENE.GHVN01072971.1~~GHVN01072971.1.p1  ORF type:complete len:1015 (-),score=145.95 GHVN01072971.1:493-3537(-)
MYHPEVYKRMVCRIFTEDRGCCRFYCPFAHGQQEVKSESTLDLASVLDTRPDAQEELCPRQHDIIDTPPPQLRDKYLADMLKKDKERQCQGSIGGVTPISASQPYPTSLGGEIMRGRSSQSPHTPQSPPSPQHSLHNMSPPQGNHYHANFNPFKPTSDNPIPPPPYTVTPPASHPTMTHAPLSPHSPHSLHQHDRTSTPPLQQAINRSVGSTGTTLAQAEMLRLSQTSHFGRPSPPDYTHPETPASTSPHLPTSTSPAKSLHGANSLAAALNLQSPPAQSANHLLGMGQPPSSHSPQARVGLNREIDHGYNGPHQSYPLTLPYAVAGGRDTPNGMPLGNDGLSHAEQRSINLGDFPANMRRLNGVVKYHCLVDKEIENGMSQMDGTNGIGCYDGNGLDAVSYFSANTNGDVSTFDGTPMSSPIESAPFTPTISVGKSPVSRNGSRTTRSNQEALFLPEMKNGHLHLGNSSFDQDEWGSATNSWRNMQQGNGVYRDDTPTGGLTPMSPIYYEDQELLRCIVDICDEFRGSKQAAFNGNVENWNEMASALTAHSVLQQVAEFIRHCLLSAYGSHQEAQARHQDYDAYTRFIQALDSPRKAVGSLSNMDADTIQSFQSLIRRQQDRDFLGDGAQVYEDLAINLTGWLSIYWRTLPGGKVQESLDDPYFIAMFIQEILSSTSKSGRRTQSLPRKPSSSATQPPPNRGSPKNIPHEGISFSSGKRIPQSWTARKVVDVSSRSVLLQDLLSNLARFRGKTRPPLPITEALLHPLFWSAGDRCSYLSYFLELLNGERGSNVLLERFASPSDGCYCFWEKPDSSNRRNSLPCLGAEVTVGTSDKFRNGSECHPNGTSDFSRRARDLLDLSIIHSVQTIKEIDEKNKNRNEMLQFAEPGELDAAMGIPSTESLQRAVCAGLLHGVRRQNIMGLLTFAAVIASWSKSWNGKALTTTAPDKLVPEDVDSIIEELLCHRYPRAILAAYRVVPPTADIVTAWRSPAPSSSADCAIWKILLDRFSSRL